MFEHLGDELGIERARDLVEQQHARLHRERPHDGDPLLLAARQPVGILVRLVGEADALEERHRSRLGVVLAAARGRASARA